MHACLGLILIFALGFFAVPAQKKQCRSRNQEYSGCKRGTIPEINRYAEMENSTTAEALRRKEMGNYPLTTMATARHPLLAKPGRSAEHIRPPR